MDITTLTPQEHDEVYLERLLDRQNKDWEFSRRSNALLYTFCVQLADESVKYNRKTKWVFPTAERYVHSCTYQVSPEEFASIEGVSGSDVFFWWNTELSEDERAERSYNHILSEITAYEEALDAFTLADSLVKECQAHYSKHKWARYWLVVSSDGHIHSSTYCSTCNKGREATQFALVPYLSDASVADAVADLGAGLCSVCFPDAPSDSKEQVKISARIALVLAEQGSEAFKVAREKARIDAQKRNAEKCDGSGQQTVPSDRSWLHSCPVCGYYQRQSGKVRAHRRPRFYAVQCPDYGSDKYWNGSEWAPSTKKVAFASEEEAQAVVDAHGGTKVYSE